MLRIACRHAPKDQLIWRHIGVTPDEAQDMVKVIGCDSLDQLIDETVPPHLRFKGTANLPEPIGERAMLQEMVSVGAKNKVYRTYLGQGYVFPTLLAVICCEYDTRFTRFPRPSGVTASKQHVWLHTVALVKFQYQH